MRIPFAIFFVLGLVQCIRCAAPGTTGENKEDDALLDCFFEDGTTACLRTRIARDMDKIEVEVMGKPSDLPISKVMEQAGNLMAEVVDDLQKPEGVEENQDQGKQAEDREIEEGRKKKFGKKKKKHLQKLLGIVMLFKAKLSLLLQLISTHFQLKFFVIAVISLILNATKFWLDLKKAHSPSKVIYYEHAQHQHHYDHDDHDHGYWGRSSNDHPQDLAYSAYSPSN